MQLQNENLALKEMLIKIQCDIGTSVNEGLDALRDLLREDELDQAAKICRITDHIDSLKLYKPLNT